ncbi:DUF4380 domain-containing protein [bacterium]|nr:DUF4380 domain-containing protein [bacterium]
MQSLIRIVSAAAAMLLCCTGGREASPPGDLGGGIYRIYAGPVVMTVDASRGARIISLTYEGREILCSERTHPENFGSTLWTSPQSDWGWPPYPVLDTDPYQAGIEKNVLRMISEPDPESGYRFEKHFRGYESDTLIEITYVIENVSDQNKRVAPWEVTRVPAGGMSFFPGSADGILPYSTLDAADSQGILWLFDDPGIGRDKKFFAHGREGWLAYAQDSLLFVKQFPDIPDSLSAPNESDVEIFAAGTYDYVELECQGAYLELAPGEFMTWQVMWYLRQAPAWLVPGEMDAALVRRVRALLE